MQLKLISFFGTCTCFERRDTKSEHAFEAPRQNDSFRVPDHQPRAFHLAYFFNECFDRAENQRVDSNHDFPPSVPGRACTKTAPSTRTPQKCTLFSSFLPLSSSLTPSSILSTPSRSFSSSPPPSHCTIFHSNSCLLIDFSRSQRSYSELTLLLSILREQILLSNISSKK